MDQLSLISFPIAFAAGFVSFASPCVLALVPGYLSFISGVPADQVEQRWKSVIRPTLAFILGFAIMFSIFGASAGRAWAWGWGRGGVGHANGPA